jgi:hypothetical protein
MPGRGRGRRKGRRGKGRRMGGEAVRGWMDGVSGGGREVR